MAGFGSSIRSRVSNPNARNKSSEGARPEQLAASPSRGTVACRAGSQQVPGVDSANPPSPVGRFITVSVVEGETPGRERGSPGSHGWRAARGQHRTGLGRQIPGNGEGWRLRLTAEHSYKGQPGRRATSGFCEGTWPGVAPSPDAVGESRSQSLQWNPELLHVGIGSHFSKNTKRDKHDIEAGVGPHVRRATAGPLRERRGCDRRWAGRRGGYRHG